MSSASQLPHLMTVAAFLEWETPDGSDRWELVDGIPEAIAPASPRHSLMQAEAARILGHHLAEHPHCRLVTAPSVRPRAGLDNYNVRIPDLAVTSEPVSKVDRLLHTPLLVVEILSPSDWRRTWANVALYTTISSVREILVLHTAETRAVLLKREPDGTWPNKPMALAPGVSVRLDSISFIATVAAFYRTAGVA
jgi:Uma2 family endonuclease